MASNRTISENCVFITRFRSGFVFGHSRLSRQACCPKVFPYWALLFSRFGSIHSYTNRNLRNGDKESERRVAAPVRTFHSNHPGMGRSVGSRNDWRMLATPELRHENA